MANKKIEEIEGIGPVLGEKFTSAGVPDTDTLLEKGCTKSGRKEIADATGATGGTRTQGGIWTPGSDEPDSAANRLWLPGQG